MIAKKEKVLEEFSRHGNFSRACRAVGVPRVTGYYWVKNDKTFGARYEEIKAKHAQ